MHIDYLEKILNAQVYDVAIETPLELAPNLSRRIGNTVLFKREDMQPVFSFKLRGAYNKIAQLSEEVRARGVICASAGNHAQGVALAAAKLGCRAVIVMPTTTPRIKVDAVAARGGGRQRAFLYRKSKRRRSRKSAATIRAACTRRMPSSTANGRSTCWPTRSG